MRRLISVFVLIGMTLFAVSVNGAEGKVGQITLKVDGMSCASCAPTVKIALERLDGVISADVSFKEARATVQYQEGKVTVEQMIKTVEGIGYKASLLIDGKK